MKCDRLCSPITYILLEPKFICTLCFIVIIVHCSVPTSDIISKVIYNPLCDRDCGNSAYVHPFPLFMLLQEVVHHPHGLADIMCCYCVQHGFFCFVACKVVLYPVFHAAQPAPVVFPVSSL